MITKTWLDLTDEEKTKVMKEFLKTNGLQDFDYAQQRKEYEKMKLENPTVFSSVYTKFNNPCLVLKLVDPILTHTILSWLYSKPKEFNMQIPFMGYELEEFTFDKSTLMSYSNEEQQILSAAMQILQKKGVTL